MVSHDDQQGLHILPMSSQPQTDLSLPQDSSLPLLDPSDPLGLLSDGSPEEQPSSYPPLVGSHPEMPSTYTQSSGNSIHNRPRVTSESEISHLDLNFSGGNTRNAPQFTQSSSFPSQSELRGTGNRPPLSQSQRRNNPGLRIELPPRPAPLRVEDLESEAVTSDSTSYVNGHSNLLANRGRRHNQQIQTSRAAAILDPLRHTSSGEVHSIGYGYGYEDRSAGPQTQNYRTETSYFEDALHEIRSSCPVHDPDCEPQVTYPDIHNSMSPFDMVNPDFIDYHAAELARQRAEDMIADSFSFDHFMKTYSNSMNRNPFV